jgi:ATP/maltotriose-dependent transcriptional regulator MalT
MSDLNSVVDYVECSAAALDAAEKIIKQAEDAQKKASEKIAAAVDALIAHERIDPKDREKCAAMLKDPVKVLEILEKTADTNRTIRPHQLGKAVQEKKASASSPYVGLRSSQARASDLRFDEVLGING